MRKPEDYVHINVRLRESLRQRLAQSAKRHQFSLVNEIRARLQDSFEQDEKRRLDNIRRGIEIAWLRFSARFLRIEFADQLADAVLAGAEPSLIQTLARTIVEQRRFEQRPSEGVS